MTRRKLGVSLNVASMLYIGNSLENAHYIKKYIQTLSRPIHKHNMASKQKPTVIDHTCPHRYSIYICLAETC